jgi:GT2 family glycosyltransferase/glycosyltransferase involved in cell wall biosynthesis/SAM-dependent methyltransferase
MGTEQATRQQQSADPDSERQKWNRYYQSLPLGAEDAATREFNAELAERVIELLPGGGDVLEAGCGGAWQSLALARTGRFRVAAMDFSEAALAYARRLFEREGVASELVLGDVFESGKPEFDLVFNAGVLEHYTLEQQAAFLRGMASRSRRYVLALVPNASCYWYWLWRIHHAAWGNWSFGKEVPLSNLSGAFQAAGLQFLGQRFLGAEWTESFIESLAGIDPAMRGEILEIHRSPLLAPQQKCYLVAALGSVRPERAVAGWTSPKGRESTEVADLSAALADALALRVSGERRLRQLEEKSEDFSTELRQRDSTITERERMIAERERIIGSLGSERDAALERLDRELAAKDREIQLQVAARRDQERKVEELLGRTHQSIEAYRTQFEQELLTYRSQRAWKIMLAVRKAYDVLVRRGSSGSAGILKWLMSGPMAEAALQEQELRFPDIRQYVPPELAEAAAESQTQALPAGASAPHKYDVVILGIIDFDFRFQRPQQIASQFARNGHRVFWVSPSRTVPGDSDEPYHAVRLRERIWEIKLRWPQPGIYVGTLEPDIRNLAVDALARVYRDFAIPESIVIAQLPYWRQIGTTLREQHGAPLVYDCMDDWETFPSIGPFNVSEERELARECDVLVVTGQELVQKFSQRGLNPLLVRNGADFEFFSQGVSNSSLAGLKRPVVGYFGAIADWIDLDLIEEVARQRPDYSFVLIGQVFERDTSRLARLPNVNLLGSKQYREIPSYLAQFDACIIPFVLNQVTHATDPVKLYEYFSLGKPVVATNMTELAQCRELLYIGKDAAHFAQQLDCALNEADGELKERRIAFAAHNTWGERVDTLDRAVRQKLPALSIVIVTHQSGEYIGPCLSSVLRNTCNPNFEIVVADNASTDGTRDVLHAMAAADERIRLVLLDENRGFAGANNIALEQASGDYLILLNADTMVTPGWTERLIRHCRRNPSIGLICPVTNYAGNEVKININYQDNREMQDFAMSLARRHSGECSDIGVAPLFCALMPQAVWQRVGALDERYEIGMFEDDDFSVRVRNEGFRVVMAEDCFVHHFGQGSFAKLSPEAYDQTFEKNRRRFEEKWKRPWMPHRPRPNVRPAFEEKRFKPSEFVAVDEEA